MQNDCNRHLHQCTDVTGAVVFLHVPALDVHQHMFWDVRLCCDAAFWDASCKVRLRTNRRMKIQQPNQKL